MFIHKIFILLGLFFLTACTTSVQSTEAVEEIEYVSKDQSDKQALDYAVAILFIEMAAGKSSFLKMNRDKCENCYFPEITELALLLIGKLKTEESKNTIVNLTSLQLDGAGSELRSELLGENNNELWDDYLQSSPFSLNQWCLDNFENSKGLIKEYMPDITEKEVCWDVQKLQDDLNYLRNYKVN